jgi:hypothetical protein
LADFLSTLDDNPEKNILNPTFFWLYELV